MTTPQSRYSEREVARASESSATAEVRAAHQLLDGTGTPRYYDGHAMSLPERIAHLHGRLISAEEMSCHTLPVQVHRSRRHAPADSSA